MSVHHQIKGATSFSWLGKRVSCLIFAVCITLGIIVASVSNAQSQEATCTDYITLSETQKVILAYGYFEGVHASLNKDVADVLVPPFDARHPAWWVLPSGVSENPFENLAKTLDHHCHIEQNRTQALLDAFLSIAYKKSGYPAFGISNNKKKTDPWKGVLEGKGSVSCSAYNGSASGTRQAMIYGYYLGTKALKRALKSSADSGIVWPAKLSPEAVRIEVDKRCQKNQTSNVRDVLWLTTAELAVQYR